MIHCTQAQLHVRWKECASNLASALSDAFHHPTLNDVHLVASEDGQLFKANPLVLASASPFLKSLLLEAPDMGEETVLLLAGVSGVTLQDLLRFVYYGEVRLGPSRLAPLLSLANDLGIDAIKDLDSAELRTDYTDPLHALGTPQPNPGVTGLSLLASAALKAEDHQPPPQPLQLNIEGSNPSVALHSGAMNLSIKDEYNAKTSSNKILYPTSHLLNIPDPSHFKWKRAFMRVSPSSSENGDKIDLTVEDRQDETPPPLAIDMTSSNRADPPSMADLPATPSPSPSSLVGTPCFNEQNMPMEENRTSPILVLPYGESGTPRLSSQSSNGEGKRWKSRQPKLCIHCDRYFSNQFNLKQVR